MILKIFQEDEEQEAVIYLRLKQGTGSCCGEIHLSVCDANGDVIGGGNILSIGPEGIQRKMCFGKAFGFKMDDDKIAIR